jgi:hypothetical protein
VRLLRGGDGADEVECNGQDALRNDPHAPHALPKVMSVSTMND